MKNKLFIMALLAVGISTVCVNANILDAMNKISRTLEENPNKASSLLDSHKAAIFALYAQLFNAMIEYDVNRFERGEWYVKSAVASKARDVLKEIARRILDEQALIAYIFQHSQVSTGLMDVFSETGPGIIATEHFFQKPSAKLKEKVNATISQQVKKAPKNAQGVVDSFKVKTDATFKKVGEQVGKGVKLFGKGAKKAGKDTIKVLGSDGFKDFNRQIAFPLAKVALSQLSKQAKSRRDSGSSTSSSGSSSRISSVSSNGSSRSDRLQLTD